MAKRHTEANANVTLLAAAAIVVAFMGNAAAESPVWSASPIRRAELVCLTLAKRETVSVSSGAISERLSRAHSHRKI